MEQQDKINEIMLTREIENTIHQIILACGKRPLKEKISLLYLSIDYIFENNKELDFKMFETITFH